MEIRYQTSLIKIQNKIEINHIRKKAMSVSDVFLHCIPSFGSGRLAF